MTFAELDGILVALDLNHRPALGTFDELWSIVEPRIRQVHLLVISVENLLTLTGATSEAALSELRSKLNLPYLACTWKRDVPQNHPDESATRLRETDESQPAAPADCQQRWSAVAHSLGIASTRDRRITHLPIEPLGGGDAWLAGFIDGLLGGLDPDSCCRRADLLAALTQRTFGDLGEVTREELSVRESIEGAVDLSEDG
jgi:sugar/nucleoside kinase (ribokinase family)